MTGVELTDIEKKSGKAETVFLGIGGNIGDRIKNLRRAMLSLMQHPEIEITCFSRVWESEYVGLGEQESYLNACVQINTILTPMQLLIDLKKIEKQQGRLSNGHNLPRPVDLDILLFGEIISADPNLTLPHPRCRDRAFVLEPLSEIAGQKKFPDSGETVASACAKIRRKRGPWVKEYQEEKLLPCAADATKEEWRAALAVHCS